MEPVWADWDLIQWILQIISLPLQLIQFAVYSVGNFVVFDVLQLGPVLPIESPF